MTFLRILILLAAVAAGCGCTTVANPAPNSQILECHDGEQRVCSGATGSRLEKDGKDPHSTCYCESRFDQQ